MNGKSTLNSKNAAILSIGLLAIIALAIGLVFAQTNEINRASNAPAKMDENQAVPAKDVISAPQAVPDTGVLESSSKDAESSRLREAADRYHFNDGKQTLDTLSPAQQFHFNDGRQH